MKMLLQELSLQIARREHRQAAVGAAPVTRACLTHDMVCHHSKDDPKHVLYMKIQDSNDTACALLTARGFGGSNLQVQS